MNKIIEFLKQSNRYKHLIGGLLVGILAFTPWTALYAAAVAASCLELKDKLKAWFPFLAPLRRFLQVKWFYLRMRLDGNRYARGTAAPLPEEVFSAGTLLLNENSGHDMAYQRNKVDNLKLAAATVDGIVIRPGETFSFWQLVRHADKEGLCLINGEIVPVEGGGLCQLSNLLFWLFLHTPLTIVERHAHAVESFPLPPSDIPDGTDATVNEGWLDLKVRNDTPATYQIVLWFDDDNLNGAVRADREEGTRYEIVGEHLVYTRENGKLYQSCDIRRQGYDPRTGEMVSDALLYHNRCRIGYDLPPGIPVEDLDTDNTASDRKADI